MQNQKPNRLFALCGVWLGFAICAVAFQNCAGSPEIPNAQKTVASETSLTSALDFIGRKFQVSDVLYTSEKLMPLTQRHTILLDPDGGVTVEGPCARISGDYEIAATESVLEYAIRFRNLGINPGKCTNVKSEAVLMNALKTVELIRTGLNVRFISKAKDGRMMQVAAARRHISRR